MKLSDEKYDSGYGGSEVASDLLVVGKDWWLERHEYDGSEWWEYKTIPIKPNTIIKNARTVFGGNLMKANDEQYWKRIDMEEEEANQKIKDEELKQLDYLLRKYR